MSVYWRHPSNTEVKQVWVGTITNTDAATYSVTATDDDGRSATITYTCANPPETTVTLAAAEFIALWNASSSPIIGKFVATQNAGQVILTAKVSGVPLTFSTGGTGTWNGVSVSTESVGNTDYGTARNWSSDSVPTNSNDVIFGAGSVGVQYGLDQSAVTLGSLSVSVGCSSQFGRFESGSPHYLSVPSGSLEYRGSAQLAMFDVGASNIKPYVESYGSPSGNRQHSVYIKGSDLLGLDVNRGKVALAGLPGDTASVETVNIGYVSNQKNDSDVLIGSGVTLTTLNQGGGNCVLSCGAATVNVASGATLTTDGTGAITELNVWGSAFLNSTGTVTTINVRGGTLDLTKVRTARTVTTVNLYNGSRLKTGSWITHTNKPVVQDGSATIEVVG